MSNLTAVAVLFACSLVGAFVVFKFLQSTASIEKSGYKVGGAAAGFLLFYGASYGSYNHLQNVQLASCQSTVGADNKRLAVDEKEFLIEGTIDPPIANATVFLIVKQANPDDQGQFLLQKKGVNLDKDSVALYVVSETEHFQKQIFPDDDVSHLKLNWK